MSSLVRQSKRLAEVVERWFLAEPILFAAWTTHRVSSNPRIENIRVRSGMIEFNPSFIAGLDQRTLTDVMRFETVRIILKHPYERRKPNGELAWEASNLALQECLQSELPMPAAADRFDSDAHSKKYFEYYYNLLWGNRTKPHKDDNSESELSTTQQDKEKSDSAEQEESDSDPANEACDDDSDDSETTDCNSKPNECDGSSVCQNCGDATCEDSSTCSGGNNAFSEPTDAETSFPAGCTVEEYCDPEFCGTQNSMDWDYDQLFIEQLNDVITDIESSNNWGTIPGAARELILASRTPRLDYRRVLRSFRSTILSTNRCLTRMKPSRRYGFEYMGSRRDFTTRLLFAVDVSGSVGTKDIRAAFAIVNRLFKYGIEQIDVLWFDTQIRNHDLKPIEIKRAQRRIEVLGRGGTCFQPIMDYLDDYRQYDGLIIFTDGIAPVPDRPKRNRRTRVVWLFNREENWKKQHNNLELPGMTSAFVLPS
ncbi:MAG: VWA-like domain-containing protein [Planctomycetaceae bacterium]